MTFKPAVTVVGMGDDGCLSLSSRAANAVASAQVLVGGTRLLEFFPQFSGEQIVLRGGLKDELERIKTLAADHGICILASGDPLFFGIGSLVIEALGSAHVEIIPHPSSMQLAFAKLKMKWDDACFISLHGRPRTGFITRLRSHRKVACFTDEENAPATLAAHLLDYGETEWTAWVCENLGGDHERIRSFSISELAEASDVGPLNVLVLVRTDSTWTRPSTLSFLHEDAFAKRVPKKGLITKREVRLLSLAALQIRPDSVIWDVGAASGSVAIEAALLAPEGKAYAIEVDSECIEMCRENLKTHRVDNVEVIQGLAPEALGPLEDPDAVFIGGSKGSMEEIIDVALKRLKAGGRLVVNAITLDNVTEAYRTFRARDLLPEVTLLNVSRGEPLARYLRYEALNPIHIFAVTKNLFGGKR